MERSLPLLTCECSTTSNEDQRTLASCPHAISALEALPSIIWSLVPGWTPLDQAGPAPNLQTSHLTMSPQSKHQRPQSCALCTVSEMYCPCPGADWVSELPSNVTLCRLSCQSLTLHLFIMSHCLIALDRDNGMHGWRSINSL